MQRDELPELHYITPIGNVPSILQHGILSHRRASRFAHESVAMQAVQDRRAQIQVPHGRPLHDYVNLYVCARNPMLYVRRAEHRRMCVLSVSPDVLDIPGAIVTDSNASSAYVRFAPSPDGLRLVDRERTFASYWTDQDPVQQWRNKAAKCAEVLVPDRVDRGFVRGVYVSCEEAQEAIDSFGTGLRIAVDPELFFM